MYNNHFEVTFPVQKLFLPRTNETGTVLGSEINFLIFEVVKLCRMKKYPPDSTFRDISMNSTSKFTLGFRIGIWIDFLITSA